MYRYFNYQIINGYIDWQIKKAKWQWCLFKAKREIKRTIDFRGTKGALLKSLMKEKEVKRLK